MDGLEKLPPDIQQIVGVVFGVVVALWAAYVFIKGTLLGPPAPKVTEFGITGQLADMGPIKELVEQTGLLVQQQVRTNIHLEAVAVAIKRGADAYEAELAAERNEAEIEAEVERRLDRQLKERRARARRKAPSKPV
jgi:hypothetical protein